MFVGRRTELDVLEKHWKSGKFELCIIYGRRRVGKTTLIRQFCRGKDTIFFTAMETSAQENLVSLSRAVLTAGQGAPVFPSFFDAFAHVFAVSRDKRMALVIDEYPFLTQSYPGISSLLQRLIDENRADSKLFLIINGSSISMMTDFFFNYKRPLYGRKTCQLKLDPLEFFALAEFFPQLSTETLVYIYGVYGGIPKYLEDYDTGCSLKDNIFKDFLQKSAPLYDEPSSILKQELREPANYNAILTAIAHGATRYSEIGGKAQIQGRNISGFLESLLSLELIKKENPVPPCGSKRSLYRLNDNMLMFWYRFIPINISLISQGKAELAWQSISTEFETYMGHIFEQIALQYLWRINGSGTLPFAFIDAGRWWGTDPAKREEIEIDIIAHDGKTKALFCECKWWKQKVGPDVLDGLAAKAACPLFDNFKQRWLCLFSRKGFSAACLARAKIMNYVFLISYADMMKNVNFRS
jgi:AAA+ ATPase superfamily predicted ATPase